MGLNRDFEDLLHCFNAARAKYLIIGAYAVIFYTEPRYTKDIDLWIEPSPENARRVYQALRRFGAPLKNLSVEDLTDPNLVYQIGVEPNRIDILMGVGQSSFAQAWKRRKVGRYGGERTHLIALEDLIRLKEKAGRPQDQVDLQVLSGAVQKKAR